MKSDKVTVQKRVEEILSLRLLGAEFPDIRQHASAGNWNVSDRQLFRYIAAGDELLARTLERDREKLMNRHIAARRALYARAMAVSDYATARQVLRDEAELLNLYPARKAELTGANGGPVVLQVVEEIVDKDAAPTPLEGITEEVVTTNDSSNASNPGTDAANHPLAPGTESVPQQ